MVYFMDLVSCLANSNLILGITTKGEYCTKIKEIQEQIAFGPYSSIGYLSLNRPFTSVQAELKKMNADVKKFFFVDAITATVQSPPIISNCTFISSPSDLTTLSMAFTTLYTDQGCEVIIIDTISTLVIYQSIGSVIKFVHNLVTKARVLNKKLLLVALKEDSEDLIKDLNMFVDRVEQF